MTLHSFTVVEVCDSLSCRRAIISGPHLPFHVWLGTGEARAQLRCEGPLRPVAKAVAPARPDCGVQLLGNVVRPLPGGVPRLSQLSHEYAGKPVQFVRRRPSTIQKTGRKIQPFLAKNNIALNVWIGPDSAILQDFGLGDIVPGTVVIDEHGGIVGRIMGEAQDKDVRSRVDWLLNGRREPAPEALTKRY